MGCYVFCRVERIFRKGELKGIMNILIYRSQDQNILVNSAFTEELLLNFSPKYNINISIETDKEVNLKKIEEADLILFFSHGDTDEIFHRFYGPYNPHNETLVNKDNIQILSSKKVLVFSCYTSLELGEIAIDNDCPVYFGFKGKINRNLPKEILDLNLSSLGGESPEQLISSVYSEVFYKVLYKAINEDLSFDIFEKLLKLALGKTIMERFEDAKNLPFELHSKGTQPVMDTIKSITTFGNSKVKFVS